MRVEHRYIKQSLYTPAGATCMLIGTFPSVLVREAFNRLRPTDVDFFYGSIDNNFWKDLAVIYKRGFTFNRSQEAVDERINLLQELKMAMSDAIFACETTGSAMDTALNNIEPNIYIIDVLDNTPTIDTIYFTSSSGKVNAETLTLRVLKEANRITKMKITQKSGPRMRSFLFTDHNGKQRPIKSVTLYSPSPLAEQWGSLTPEKRREQYRLFLPKL